MIQVTDSGAAMVVFINGLDSIARFKELVHRATNLWPDAHPEIKEFADKVTVGHVQQRYYEQMTDKHRTQVASGLSTITGNCWMCMECGGSGHHKPTCSKIELDDDKFNRRT